MACDAAWCLVGDPGEVDVRAGSGSHAGHVSSRHVALEGVRGVLRTPEFGIMEPVRYGDFMDFIVPVQWTPAELGRRRRADWGGGRVR